MNSRSGVCASAGRGAAGSLPALVAEVGTAGLGAASEGGAGACGVVPVAVEVEAGAR